MKNILSLLFVLLISVAANAQEATKKESSTQNQRATMQDGNSSKPAEKKAVMQDGNSVAKEAEHKCNDKCKSGKHEYMHGEKGHHCGDACKKPHDTKKPD